MIEQEPLKSHLPCSDCGSSDALTIYPDNTYCFSCHVYHKSTDSGNKPMTQKRYTYQSIPDRNIELETCKKYNVQVGINRSNQEVHLYPYYNKEGKHISNKVRVVEDKTFYSEGDKKKTELFGQKFFKEGGKYITITEGEIDCLSAYQMLGSKWPVLSVRNGSASAANEIKYNLDYLNTFDNIVLCFDSDEQGQKASKEVANLLEPGTCKIMYMSLKDANEYLKAGQAQEFVKDFWNAKTYTPEGIVYGPDIAHLLLEDKEVKSLAYPWAGLNELTYGMRMGELVLITAGSGIGKSSVMRELVHYIIKKTDNNIGCLFLEENVTKTGLGILSVEASKKFHINTPGDKDWTVDDKKKALKALNDLNQVVFWNHFGNSSLTNLMTRVRYMVKGLDCKYIVIDHISMIIYDTLNERKAIDDIMVKLRVLVQELGIHMIVVSHLSRPQGTGHEEGANISLNQLRGSHSLAQLPDMIYALERNTQALNETERNRTMIRVLKNRFSGESGPAVLLQWSKDTGRLTELDMNDASLDETQSDDFE
jgi:twinkle protein|tara:strand:- start:393 stop:2003 length:1611 start_codon:yes stop_codon:yes gene_type:complete